MRGFILCLMFVPLVWCDDVAQPNENKRLQEFLKNAKLPTGNNATRRITGSADSTKPGDNPWIVSLFYNDEFICAGAIYDQRSVITTAQCVLRDPEQKNGRFFIRAGDHRIAKKEDTEQRRRVKDIIFDPKLSIFKFGSYLAVLQLKDDLNFNAYVQALEIPEPWKDLRLQDEDDCYVAGWGWSNLAAGQPTWLLRSADAPIWERSLCSTYLGINGFPLRNSQICTLNEDGLGPCVNDPGAPLVCYDKMDKPYLFGIVELAVCNGIAFHIRLSRFKDWLSS